jgi:hypothetical protein
LTISAEAFGPGDIVFTELRKLLARRSLTITVAVLENEQIRVNVVPHARPEDSKINDQIKYSIKAKFRQIQKTL